LEAVIRASIFLVPEPRVLAIEPVLSSTRATSSLLTERMTVEPAETLASPVLHRLAMIGLMVTFLTEPTTVLLAPRAKVEFSRVSGTPSPAISAWKAASPLVSRSASVVAVERAAIRVAASSASCSWRFWTLARLRSIRPKVRMAMGIISRANCTAMAPRSSSRRRVTRRVTGRAATRFHVVMSKARLPEFGHYRQGR
jgi:hypothetical protein